MPDYSPSNRLPLLSPKSQRTEGLIRNLYSLIPILKVPHTVVHPHSPPARALSLLSSEFHFPRPVPILRGCVHSLGGARVAPSVGRSVGRSTHGGILRKHHP